MKLKPPMNDADEYATLEHLPDNYKADVQEWIDEREKYVKGGFWSKKMTNEEKKGYSMALNHLHYAMQVREQL